MANKNTDPRIGIYKANGGVEKYPTQYIDGTRWDRQTNAFSTKRNIGNNQFVILRNGQGDLTEDQKGAVGFVDSKPSTPKPTASGDKK